MPLTSTAILLVAAESRLPHIAPHLAQAGFDCKHVANREDVVAAVASSQARAVLIDMVSAEHGLELAAEINDLAQHPPLALIVNQPLTELELTQAQERGVLYILRDPLNSAEQLFSIRVMLRLHAEKTAITERLNELDQLASTDVLTGLYNRRMFMNLLDQELSRARRTKRPVYLIYLDIDYFKKINDKFGHRGGDIVLTQIAAMLADQLRLSDVLGRVGGEEFIVLLPETSAEHGAMIAERLRVATEKLQVEYEGSLIPVTVSLGGLSLSEPAGQTPAQLISQADAALYRAKEQGRNRVELATFEADTAKAD